jgi:hypothetical protein
MFWAFISVVELMNGELPAISPWRGTARGRGSTVGASSRELAGLVRSGSASGAKRLGVLGLVMGLVMALLLL